MNFEDIFYNRLAPSPYCSNNVKQGLKIRTKKEAITYQNIQPNTPIYLSSMVFDLDFAGASNKWEDSGLPVPTWVSINPKNSHAHVGYMLNTPVYKGQNASLKALKYFKSVNIAYSNKLQADTNYSGLITKNPVHIMWKNVISGKMYELSELADYVDLTNIKQKTEIMNGRNCNLFNELRHYGYSIYYEYMDNMEQFKNKLLERANVINNTNVVPLDQNEIGHIVKSILKWIVKNYNPFNFRNKQREIRLFVGERTKQSIQSENGTPKDIAEKLNVSLSTVYRHIDTPKIKNDKSKPWEDMNISRATYYRKLIR